MTGHLPHQTLDTTRLQERRRRLRLRILREHLGLERDQASDLVLLVFRVVNPRSRGGGAGAQPTAIDLDGHQVGGLGHADRQPSASLSGLGVALLHQFLSGLQGQGADVLRTQGQSGQLQREGGIGERTQAGGGLDDQASGSRAVGVVIEAQQRPLGGKSPADRRDNVRPVHWE